MTSPPTPAPPSLIQGGNYDITVTPGTRYDQVFQWNNAAGDAMPMAGFTAVMTIYQGQEVLFVSGPTGDIQLTQEPSGATGQLWVYLGQDITSGLLTPYGVKTDYSYSIALIDNVLGSNLVPFLYGAIIPTKGFAV